MKIDYSGKVVFISGSSMGIGLGCAEVFAECGAHVILNSLQAPEEAAVKEALLKIESKNNGVEYLQGDVSSSQDIRRMVHAIEQRHGKLDILVNNAGMNLFKGIEATSMAEFDKIIGVDLRGLFEMTKEMLPLLKKGSEASVIHVASVHAMVTMAEITAYAAAKGAVVAMTRSLAQELGLLGIRVNSVSPGFVATPMYDRWVNDTPNPQATLDRVNQLHPLRKVATSRDVGNSIAFLASPFASSITGINLVIDCGLTTRVMH